MLYMLLSAVMLCLTGCGTYLAVRVPTAAEATGIVTFLTSIAVGLTGVGILVYRQIFKARLDVERERSTEMFKIEREKTMAMIALQKEKDAALKETLSGQNTELLAKMAELKGDLNEAKERADRESIAARQLRTDLQMANSINLELTRNLRDSEMQSQELRREMYKYLVPHLKGYVEGEDVPEEKQDARQRNQGIDR